jgi:hypothetical protein
MALLYGYGTGSTIESFRYDQVVDLLNQIPNNTTNLVKTKDVRDSVFTLWERINDLTVLIASSSTPTTYMNTEPTTMAIGGIGTGTTFPIPQTVQQMFDAILYPYTLPISSINVVSSISNITPISTQKEYGQSLSTVLYWSVTKKSNPIVSIVINGVTITTITGETQVGWRTVSGTYSSISGSFPLTTTNDFVMVVNDGTTNVNTSTSITWLNKIYWGSIDLSGLIYPNPDLTENPSYITLVSTIITSNLIKSLDGAGVGSGSELSISKNKTYNSINGDGKYLIFTWPSSVSGALTPTFTVNGLTNTAFTRAKTDWEFTNIYNVSTNYEVWVSNTKYNSVTNVTVS